MRKGVAILAFISALLLSFLCFRLFLADMLGLGKFPFQFHDPNVPGQSEENKTNRVVILTGASYEKLRDFEGIEGFYQKMWDSRLSFAEAHGKSPVELG